MRSMGSGSHFGELTLESGLHPELSEFRAPPYSARQVWGAASVGGCPWGPIKYTDPGMIRMMITMPGASCKFQFTKASDGY